MRIYNTLSGKKEKLAKPKNRPLKLFVCGPTVYDYSHIGHARTYLAFDIIVRYLRASGFKIFYLQNITNVDDKIIERARQRNKKPLALANFFEKEHYRSMKELGIISINRYARATDFISQIVKQVKTLIAKGYAYKIEGDGYYFDIAKFKNYGRLSKRTVQQAEDATSRIDESVKKRNRGDFCLWKFSKPGEPVWRTPLGPGRPGWHIEDTAISEYYFGPQYDLHGGAIDLKFPHHEAEIAQQEAASGKRPFVKIWMHAGFLLVDGKKMSKSLGNFITIKGFLEKQPAEILRLIILLHHYRSPVNYTEELLGQAEKSLQTLREFIGKLEFMINKANKSNRTNKTNRTYRTNWTNKIDKAMADDFNTPAAVAAIFELINELNPKIWSLSKKEAGAIRQFLSQTLEMFGLKIKTPKIPQKIKKLAAERELFRTNKQFIRADALRNRIKRLGYEVEDTSLGPWLKPI